MKNFFLTIFISFFLFQTVNACETGFACSIDKLQETNLENTITQILNEYFSKEINEDVFFSILDSNIEYNDLFIYKNSVLYPDV